MSDFAVEVDRSRPLRNALVLTAFPSLGNVSSIAARFFVEVAGLECAGGIYSPRLPALANVHDGWPVPPVEIFAGERACGMDGICESLVVITSPAPVPDEAAHDLAATILDFSRDVGSGEVAVLEGMGQSADDESHLVGLASSLGGRERLQSHKIPLLKDGVIGGLSGVLLHRGASWGLDVYGFFVRANEKTPDARAAAHLVRTVDHLLVRAGLDDGALDESVTRVEAKLRRKQSEAGDRVRVRDVAYA